jgi:hypothetical protein
MAIFKKRIYRNSYIDVAIEADNQKEAQSIYDDWLDDECACDDYFDAFEENMKQNEVWLPDTYSNVDEYNRSESMADFLIAKPKVADPLYDLYFCFEEDPNHTKRKIWSNIPMVEVVNHISEANENYILKPSAPRSYETIENARERGVTIMVFELYRRNK